MNWKKGRGKLGVFEPLIGSWQFSGDSERGPITCRRTFTFVLDRKYVQLDAAWEGKAVSYQEHCLFGVGKEKQVQFWSFTSDGKQSQGVLADATDVHAKALGFEAQMERGLARQAYWPADEGFFWAVESKTKKGWNRFVDHHYLPA